jgi:hypothetical protein
MDDEAAQQLIAQAKLQDAREEAKHARTNLPFGVAMIASGAALTIGLTIVQPGLIGTIVVAAFAFSLIPFGVAVLVRSTAAIARAKRVARELEVPAARVLPPPQSS